MIGHFHQVGRAITKRCERIVARGNALRSCDPLFNLSSCLPSHSDRRVTSPSAPLTRLRLTLSVCSGAPSWPLPVHTPVVPSPSPHPPHQRAPLTTLTPQPHPQAPPVPPLPTQAHSQPRARRASVPPLAIQGRSQAPQQAPVPALQLIPAPQRHPRPQIKFHNHRQVAPRHPTQARLLGV